MMLRTDDRGNASVEMVLLVVPVVLAFMSLVVLVGRDYSAAIAVDGLAHSAARAASLHNDQRAAQQAAENAVAESIGGWGRACADPAVSLEPTTVEGLAATKARVTCESHRDDLGALFVSGDSLVIGEAVSVHDRYRSGEP